MKYVCVLEGYHVVFPDFYAQGELSTLTPLAFRMPFLSGANDLRFPPALEFFNRPSMHTEDLSQPSLQS